MAYGNIYTMVIFCRIAKYLILLSPYWTPRQDPYVESKWRIVEKERKDTESVNWEDYAMIEPSREKNDINM